MHRYLSQSDLDFRRIREFVSGTASEHLGIRLTVIGPDFLIAEAPVDERTTQPFGLLHGGVSMVIAEELGSIASAFLLRDEPGARPVGVDINGTHVRSARSGIVTGICRPLKTGRTMHYWQIRIHDDAGRLCCSARLTIHVVRRAGESGV